MMKNVVYWLVLQFLLLGSCVAYNQMKIRENQNLIEKQFNLISTIVEVLGYQSQ